MRKILCLFIALAMLIFLVPAKASALMLGFDPVSQEVPVGASVDVALTISGLGDGTAPSLGAFDVDIGFDPTVLSFDSAAFGDPILGDQLDLSGFGSFTGVTPGYGTVNLFEISVDTVDDLNNLQAGSFTLATLTFDAIGLGISPLEISRSSVLSDALGFPLDATLVPGSIAAVPEPSTMFLLGTGLLGVAGFRKKLRKS